MAFVPDFGHVQSCNLIRVQNLLHGGHCIGMHCTIEKTKETENSGPAGLVARYLAEGRNKQASFFVRLAQSTNCKLRIKVITTNE